MWWVRALVACFFWVNLCSIGGGALLSGMPLHKPNNCKIEGVVLHIWGSLLTWTLIIQWPILDRKEIIVSMNRKDVLRLLYHPCQPNVSSLLVFILTFLWVVPYLMGMSPHTHTPLPASVDCVLLLEACQFYDVLSQGCPGQTFSLLLYLNLQLACRHPWALLKTVPAQRTPVSSIDHHHEGLYP